MYTGFAPRRTAMSTCEKASHGLGEVSQGLLLHRLRPSRQPVVFAAGLGQLCRLLVIPRGATSWLPILLLLYSQVPHKPGMPAMLQQHRLLRRCGHQPEPRHIRKVSATTDTNSDQTDAHFRIAVHKCLGFPPKEVG
jgi:hypothetical protein